jgi:LysR family transcriptional regulator for metE and metH
MHLSGCLNRQDFELVLAIAEERSVTRAALRMHLSQSAASHHLRSLEDRLGAPLFRRLRRQMLPLPLGEEFVARARRVLREFRDSEEAIERAAGGRTRIIRLGTECYTSFHWLPALARELARISDLEVRIVPEATQRAKAALAAGETDAVILQSAGSDPGLRYWPLFEDELILLASSRHRLARQRSVGPGELADEPLIIHDMPGGRLGAIDEFFVGGRAYPSRVTRVQLTEAIVEMVRADLGVSILARWLATPYVRGRDLALVRLGRGLRREWRLATVEGHPRSREIGLVAGTLARLLERRGRPGAERGPRGERQRGRTRP